MARQADSDQPETAGVTTPSGIEVPIVVSADTAESSDPGLPGQAPYTRGIFENGFRGRMWTIRQYSGFGSAEESNQRYRFLLDQGQTGLSVSVHQPHRVLRCHRVDPRSIRERPVPQALVPVVTAYPIAVRLGGRHVSNAVHELPT